jgi:hypothetical protein
MKTFSEKKFLTLRDRLGVKNTVAWKLPFVLLMHCLLCGGGGGCSHVVFSLSSFVFNFY